MLSTCLYIHIHPEWNLRKHAKLNFISPSVGQKASVLQVSINLALKSEKQNSLGFRYVPYYDVRVSDYVPDVVMSSLKTCNMNCRGPLREKGGGELGIGGGQFNTNQGRVWTNIRATSTKGGFPSM